MGVHKTDTLHSFNVDTNNNNNNNNNILEDKQPLNKILETNFVCDNSGKLYPDPETQCRVKK